MAVKTIEAPVYQKLKLDASDDRPFFSIGAEKAAVPGLIALVVYAFIRSVFAAAAKPFWHDEIGTWVLARQPSVRDLLTALHRSADGNPPVFYLIERFFSHIGSNEQIAYRIPSVIGFCCVLACLFSFMRKRSGSVYALLCSSVLLITAFFGFAEDARPYSLMLACISFALVCYQRAPALRWVFPLGLSLALAETMHYYAVFAFVPFFLAESVQLFATRRFRLGVWIALACGFLPLAYLWPFLRELKAYYGSHFWSKPSLFVVGDTYGMFLHVPAAIGIAASAAAALGVIVAMRSQGGVRLKTGSSVPLHEYALVLGFLSLPFVVFTGMRLIHGGMTDRYALAAVLGIPLAISYAAPRLNRSGAILLAAFVLLTLGFQELSFWQGKLRHFGKLSYPSTPVENLANIAGHSDLPIVISADINYLPILHYASPEWKLRFVTLVDSQKAIARTGSDSVESQLAVLKSYIPMRAYDLETFETQHPDFLVYSHRAAQIGDWWPVELASEGKSVKLLAGDGAGRMYLVSTKTEQQDQ